MSKKKWITEILLCSFAISITACATSEESRAEMERRAQQQKQQQQQQSQPTDKKVTYNLHAEKDTTDALAVPSDSTEEEQEEEIQELQDLEKDHKKSN